MFWRFLMYLSGWRSFTHDGVKIFQANILVDQGIIVAAIEATNNVRRWCKNKNITIYIERGVFRGHHGATSSVEVLRYSKGETRRLATVRIAASSMDEGTLIGLLGELNRVD